jgi:nitrogenase molybdenum-iron protein alpha/beta subunit
MLSTVFFPVRLVLKLRNEDLAQAKKGDLETDEPIGRSTGRQALTMPREGSRDDQIERSMEAKVKSVRSRRAMNMTRRRVITQILRYC